MMDRDKQEGFTVQGRDTPVPVRGLSGRAGSPGPLASDCSAPLVATQASGGYRATGEDLQSTSDDHATDDEVQRRLFKGRAKVARSPVQRRERYTGDIRSRERVYSLLESGNERIACQAIKEGGTKRKDRASLSEGEMAGLKLPYNPLIWEEDQTRSVKKPKEAEGGKRDRKPSPGAGEEMRDKVRLLLKSVDRELRSIKKIIGENKNTKVELKRGVEKLNNIVSQLTTREVYEALEGLEDRRRASIINDNEDRGTQTEGLAPADKRTIATQTEKNAWQKRNDRSAEKIKERIDNVRDFLSFKETFNETWPDEAFRTVRETAGNPLKDDVELNLAFWTGKDVQVEKGVFRQLTERFPDLLELSEEERTGEEMVCLVYESRRVTRDGYRNTKRRTVTSLKEGEAPEESYKSLTAWKEKLEELGVRRVAFPVPDIGWENQKKVMEYVLWGSDITAMGKNRERIQPQKKPKSNSLKTPKRREERDVVIIQSGKPYLEALAQIKKNVNAKDLGIEIKRTSSTKNGSVILTVGKGERDGETLRREVMSKLGNQGFTARGGRREETVLHIKGMETTTTAEDVESSIKDILGANDGGVRMSAMRPAFGGTQNITITVGREAGKKLMARSPLQIGWAACPIVERVEIRRCLKCWRAGHLARSCNNQTDWSKNCLKCANPGHAASECGNTPFCPICTREGHRAGTMSCPVFRKEVKEQTDTREGRKTPRRPKRTDRRSPIPSGSGREYDTRGPQLNGTPSTTDIEEEDPPVAVGSTQGGALTEALHTDTDYGPFPPSQLEA